MQNAKVLGHTLLGVLGAVVGMYATQILASVPMLQTFITAHLPQPWGMILGAMAGSAVTSIVSLYAQSPKDAAAKSLGFGYALKLILLAGALSLAIAPPAHAQQYAFGVSAGADASVTPHTHGDFSLYIGDGTTWSYTQLSARGPQKLPNPRFVFAFQQGVQRKIAQLTPKLYLIGDAIGGIATSTDIVAGIITARGGLAWLVRPKQELVIGGGVRYSKADGGVSPAIAVEFRFLPQS